MKCRLLSDGSKIGDQYFEAILSTKAGDHVLFLKRTGFVLGVELMFNRIITVQLFKIIIIHLTLAELSFLERH